MSTDLIQRIRENVPQALRELPIWMLWALVKGDEKPKKVPVYADGGNRAGVLDSPEDRGRLVTFEQAATALPRVPRAGGLGFALGEVPGEEILVSGMDFDGCYRDGALDDRVMLILAAADSYAEASPSGNGIHIIGTGDIGTTKKDDRGFELYSGKRFFTCTGQRLNGAHLADITDAAALARKLFGADRATRQDAPRDSRQAKGKEGPGARNKTLTSLAGSMRKAGLSAPAILEALHKENYERFDPPLPAQEVNQIAAQAAKWERGSGPQSVSGDWVPPAVATYGASFNGAAIPRRRWLLGRRRSVGELTVDAGPPGVNKSTLMLSDAVQIVTGRQILADRVHETGRVIYLAGEDARRDIEARLAGILTRYNIEPAELGDKLHVVYLAEVDPVAYTLAQMSEDIATLNVHMLGWLREYPDVLALFIDPLAAWHRLIENSNEALQLLCASLRAIAAQGERHVGIDHHVTKVAMTDPEAHVRNLAAVRGAGAIGAAIRWAFTLAKLKPETGMAYGIPENERWRYRRLDPLKASYGPDEDQVRLLRVDSVDIANGESVGVLVEVDVERARAAAQQRRQDQAAEARFSLAAALTRMLAEKRPRTMNGAATWLLANHPELVLGRNGEPLSEFTVRRRLPSMIGSGLHARLGERQTQIVLREAPGNGRPAEIDFAQIEDEL